MKKIINFIGDENGQGTAEYAMIMAGIVVVVIIAINLIGVTIGDSLNTSANQIQSR